MLNPSNSNLAKLTYGLVACVCLVALFDLTSRTGHHRGSRLRLVAPSIFFNDTDLNSESTEKTKTDLLVAKEIQLEHCKCKRTIQVVESAEIIDYNQTTCGQDAFARGSGQKVISFSFYGDIKTEYSKKKGYFDGLEGNLKLMPKYYPGWIMRVYFDLDDADPVRAEMCNLACNSTILDLCHAGQLPGTPMVDARKVFPMNWRFFPTLDPQVDLFNSRDLDSRFSDRELAAVNEWLASGASIHAMRDHPAHGTAMLGASWGTNLAYSNTRAQWQKTWKKMLEDPEAWAPRTKKGPDQIILWKYVWPWGRHSSVQQDSYLCHRYPGSKAFPTRRVQEANNFVAAVINENATLWKKCPIRCRPPEHQDWEYC